jgi:DNA polymerase-4
MNGPFRAHATILHVDLDAFFAAVEQRDRPELRGRPVIVGGGGPRDRGVVSTASYEARRFGIHSAMPLRTAGRLCPQAVFLPVDGAKYAQVSRQVMAILRRFTPLVEQVSIDEAFLDVSGSEALFGPPESIAHAIQSAITTELALTASIGVATNKLVAKVASDLRKPAGLVIVAPGDEASFLAPLPIERLWGVGPRTRDVLAEYGVRTIGDLARLAPDVLERRLGKHGPELIARARGVDLASVSQEQAEAKSVSHEHTFDVDTASWDTIERTLMALSEGVAGRLRSGAVRAATIAVKVRASDFTTVTRQRTLPAPTDESEVIWQTAAALARPQVKGIRVRLLGVAASHLVAADQLPLPEGEEWRRRRVIEASDAIRGRYGPRALTRARLLGSRVAEPFERDPNTAPEARRIGRRRPDDAGPKA